MFKQVVNEVNELCFSMNVSNKPLKLLTVQVLSPQV